MNDVQFELVQRAEMRVALLCIEFFELIKGKETERNLQFYCELKTIRDLIQLARESETNERKASELRNIQREEKCET